MKIVDGFVLRSVAGEYIIIGEGVGQVNFNKIISLNDSARYLWESIVSEGGEFSVERVAELLLAQYDVDPSRAATDAEQIVAQWLSVGIIE